MSNESAYIGYNDAIRGGKADGSLSELQAAIFTQLGEVVRAVDETVAGKLSRSEIMALLTVALDFGKVICGALDSTEGKVEPYGKHYRQTVAPLMIQMTLAGVLQPTDLPQEVQDRVKAKAA